MTGLTKKVLIFAVVMAAVAASAYFGRKAWKHYTEKNLLAQARADIAKRDLRDADLCLRRVMQIDPLSLPGSRMIADLLDSEGSTAAVFWRIRVANLEPNNVTNRFIWVQTALRVKNLPSAAEALTGVPDKYKSTADYHKLAGALAWTSGRALEAEKECSEALQLDPTNREIMLNLAIIQLALTNPVVNETARATLTQLVSDPGLGSLALHHLLADAVSHKNFTDALAYSRRINSDPAAMYSDKVEYLNLLRVTKSAQADTWQNALEKTAAYEPENAYTLARWMILSESPRTAYLWLCGLPATTQTNQAIVLIKTDCLIGMKDWSGLFNSLKSQDWGAQEFYREALTSLAQRSLGQSVEAEASWQRALHLASVQPRDLAMLTDVTGSWGWLPERSQTLQEVLDKFPDQKWAADQLTAQLYSQGDTQGLVDLITKMQSANPDDPRLKNNLSDVLLLRGVELDKAYRLASEAYLSATNNPFYTSTYAYSLLLQNKPAMALQVINGLNPEFLRIPSVSAYYGVIQAQTGHKELAREPLVRAEKGSLLPEEKALVKSALSQL
jgi:tetratricopeptide (TPR) repeat protein